MAGFREFVTGEVLTAANVNDFLMKQSVMVFADAAARTAALGSEVAEGMLTYNEDTAQLEVFDGAAFVPAGAEPPAGIGSNVVQTVKTDTFTSSSDTYVTVTGMTASITPSTATSKVLIIVQLAVGLTGNQYGHYKVTRAGTDIYRGDAAGNRVQNVFGGFANANMSNALMSYSILFLDSPGVATATEYRVEARKAGTGSVNINRSSADIDQVENGRGSSTITLIEVAA